MHWRFSNLNNKLLFAFHVFECICLIFQAAADFHTFPLQVWRLAFETCLSCVITANIKPADPNTVQTFQKNGKKNKNKKCVHGLLFLTPLLPTVTSQKYLHLLTPQTDWLEIKRIGVFLLLISFIVATLISLYWAVGNAATYLPFSHRMLGFNVDTEAHWHENNSIMSRGALPVQVY